jgi:hypothetical protein
MGPGTAEGQFLHVLVKILQAGQGSRAFLYFIENQEVGFDIDFFIQDDRYIFDYPLGIEGLFEEEVQVMPPLKINIMDLFKFPAAKFFQQESFAHLPCSLEQ